MTRRRALVAVLGLLVASTGIGAQPRGRTVRIGFLTGGANPAGSPAVNAFYDDLRKFGWVDGGNAIVDFRFAGNDASRLPDLVAGLLRLAPDVLVVGSTPAALAAKHATTKVPIVFTMVSDPVASGIVADLARPDGNLTGTTNMLPETSAKMLELLREVAPSLSQVSVVYSPDNPGKVLEVRVLQAQADRMGVALSQMPIRNGEELKRGLEEAMRRNTRGLVVLQDQVTGGLVGTIVEAAARHALPAAYQVAEFVDAGGLLSYGVDVVTQYRRCAFFVDRILRGAQPRDLPVERPTTFDLVVNAKTAKALGLTLSPSFLARASRVIQ